VQRLLLAAAQVDELEPLQLIMWNQNAVSRVSKT
jgi:hypothetical protein